MDNTISAAGKAPRIVFMGTPEFAVASLDALLRAGFPVVAVVTAPDKPAGRGMKMNESAVKRYAAEQGLPLLQPEKLKNPEFLSRLKALEADLQVVVAFRMLPEIVWNMPPMGTVNLHGSLLPQYRGAAPINWALINGEKQTGVTTFRLQQEIDTGNILLQESFPLGENETAGELHDRMKAIGAALLVKTVAGLAAGTLKDRPQDPPYGGPAQPDAGSPQGEVLLKHAPKLTAATCRIDWNKTTDEVHNLIRGLSPVPGAFTQLDGKMLKIYRSEKEPAQAAAGEAPHPGSYRTDGRTFLKFACANGYIQLKDLQLEGKKKMTVQAFLAGYRF